MTYCFAWKSNNEIYVVADSLTSSKEKIVLDKGVTSSSMGEPYKEYNSFFIAETDTKIDVKNNIVIAYAGKNIEIFEEIKTYLDQMIGCLTFEQILEYLPEILIDSELILGIRSEINRLYYLDNSGFKEIDDYITIGSGKQIPDLEGLMKDFTVTYPEPSYASKKKLTAAIAYLQMISIKNNFLEYGVGGVFCGVCIHEKIEWNDDLLYFFYDKGFENKNLVNVIVRKNSLITGSDFTGATKLFKQNQMSEVEFRKMVSFTHKAITSYIPRYITFYSAEYNNIYFCDIYNCTHTSLMRIFQRRGKKDAKTEILTMPFLLEEFLLKNKNDEKFIIPFNYLDTSLVDYIPRSQLIEQVDNIWDITHNYEHFDYPLENIQIDFEIVKYLKNGLEEYENLIIVNFEYLENKITELRDYYEGLNVQFESSKLLKELSEFLKKEWGIDKFEILIFDKNNGLCYDNDEMEEIKIENNSEFVGFVHKLLHSYYIEPEYFHLNKIFIIDDEDYFNGLFEILPDYNRSRDEADIFMLKNPSFNSKVLYSPFYYDINMLFARLAGLSYEDLGLWSPAEYTKEDLNSIKEYINDKIKNSKA